MLPEVTMRSSSNNNLIIRQPCYVAREEELYATLTLHNVDVHVMRLALPRALPFMLSMVVSC